LTDQRRRDPAATARRHRVRFQQESPDLWANPWQWAGRTPLSAFSPGARSLKPRCPPGAPAIFLPGNRR